MRSSQHVGGGHGLETTRSGKVGGDHAADIEGGNGPVGDAKGDHGDGLCAFDTTGYLDGQLSLSRGVPGEQ